MEFAIDFKDVEKLTIPVAMGEALPDGVKFTLYDDGEPIEVDDRYRIFVEGSYRDKGKYRPSGEGFHMMCHRVKDVISNEAYFTVTNTMTRVQRYIDCVLVVEERTTEDAREYPFLIDVSEGRDESADE